MFGRPGKLPEKLRPALEADERVIAWAAAGDAAVVVTNRGLWLPGADGRLFWYEIHKATWAEGTLTITPSERTEGPDYAVAADAAPVAVALTDPGAVPRRIRERVNASVAYTSLYPVPGGAARVVGRRVSGRDGLIWSVRFEGGTDPDDPEVRTAVDEAVASAKASLAPVD